MNHRSRFLSLLLAAVLLSVALAFPASADDAGIGEAAYYDAGSGSSTYHENHYGIVVGTRMTVRDQPSTRGASLGSLKNGQPVKIVGVSPDSNFYMVDLQSCGISTVSPGSYGYAKASLIKIDPYFIATTKLTNLYATPWTMNLKNGEQSNRFFLVLEQSNNWYAVQTTESSAGTSFILTRDVGRYSSGYQQNYVITWDAPVFDENTWGQIRTLKRFSVGSLVSSTEEHYLLVFNQGTADEFRGWVSALYCAPLIN